MRANYNDLQKGIHTTTRFLEQFFSNLLMGTDYELKNRCLHIDFVEDSNSQSLNSKAPKSQFDTLGCTLEELAVLQMVHQNPAVTQAEIVQKTGKSLSTVKRIMDSLQAKKYILRTGGKRFGKWEILVEWK